MSELDGVRLAGKKQGWPNWTTPKTFLDALRAALGPIGFDPCSNEHSLVAAENGELLTGGLEASWVGKGLVYVNPPYNLASDFVDKAMEEAMAGAEIVALLGSRTDSQWFHSCLESADAVCFWEGRIRFGNPPPDSEGKSPSIPSAVFYWGRRRWEFGQGFMRYGFCVDLCQVRARRSTP